MKKSVKAKKQMLTKKKAPLVRLKAGSRPSGAAGKPGAM